MKGNKMQDYNIDPKKNYERISNRDVFTGQQILNLLGIAYPSTQAAILLDISETDKSADRPESKYGPAG
jgi:hypothetical protein